MATIVPEWRPFLGGLYEVSSDGRIRRLAPGSGNTRQGREIHLSVNHRGYTIFRFRCPETGKTTSRSLSRIMGEIFLGPPPTPRHQVNHIDGIKSHNVIENLEWVTPEENQRHAQRMGLRKANKLTFDIADEIRAAYFAGMRNGRLAERYGMSTAQIHMVVKGKAWLA